MNRTAEFFDGYAGRFDDIYGNSNRFPSNLVNQLFRRSMMMRFDKTIAGCQPLEGTYILDIGCGPGVYSVHLASEGAETVIGIDFSKEMTDLAERKAKKSGVSDKCLFLSREFREVEFPVKFDYSIAMGLMDYIENPQEVIAKILSITTKKAFFSFPADGGFLAWQRKLRYRNRCPLYMYNEVQLERLFRDVPLERLSIERIDRDFFVTVDLNNSLQLDSRI